MPFASYGPSLPTTATEPAKIPSLLRRSNPLWFVLASFQ